MDVKRFLQNYINVVQWDLNKMVKIAEDAELQQKRSIIENSSGLTVPTPTPAPTPSAFSIASEIDYGSKQFFESHTEEYARCAIPIVMTLTSSIEFLGALIHENNLWEKTHFGQKFKFAVSKFFEYTGHPLSENQIEIYRAIYRNGLMHSFLPQGLGIAINYDSRFLKYPLFFYNKEIDCIELNGIVLQKLVELAFQKLIEDTDIHCTIIERYKNYEKKVELDTSKIISDFLESAPTVYP